MNSAPTLAHRALNQSAMVGLLLPCDVTVEASGEGSMVRIANPEARILAGGMGSDPALVELMHEVRGRLERVAAALT